MVAEGGCACIGLLMWQVMDRAKAMGIKYSYSAPDKHLFAKRPEKRSVWSNESREQAIWRWCETVFRRQLPENRVYKSGAQK